MRSVLLSIVLLILASFTFASSSSSEKKIEPQFAYVDDKMKIHLTSSPPPNAKTDFNILANATAILTQNKTGWSTFAVTANPLRLQAKTDSRKNRELAYKAAGFLEGYLLAQSTIYSYFNTFFMSPPSCIAKFTKTNYDYVENLCLIQNESDLPANMSSSVPFWKEMCAQFQMLQGVTEGVNARAKVETLDMFPKGGWKNIEHTWSWWVNPEYMDYFIACNITMMMNSPSSSPSSPSSPPSPSSSVQNNNNDNNNNNNNENVFDVNAFRRLSLRRDPIFTSQLEQDQNEKDGKSQNDAGKIEFLNQHCSAMIKNTGNDLLFSQATWSVFGDLIRFVKTFELDETVELSGRAGMGLISVDDFYVTTKSKLAVFETTVTISNHELTMKYLTPWTIPYAFRVPVANMISPDAESWPALFLTQNSGGYCSAWHVIDLKKIEILSEPSAPAEKRQLKLHDKTFFLVDQMPGNLSCYGDLTEQLRTDSYHGSYNLIYFPECAKLAGQKANEEKYGSFFSYSHCNRANLMRRDQSKIKNMSDLEYVMRSNQWKTDPLSRIQDCDGCNPAGNPTLAIAARGDLSPLKPTSFGNLSKYMQGFFGPSGFGETDTKTSSFSLMGLFEMQKQNKSHSDPKIDAADFEARIHAQMGPTTEDGNPPLCLPKLPSYLQIVTFGQFQGEFNFPWVSFFAKSMLDTKILPNIVPGPAFSTTTSTSTSASPTSASVTTVTTTTTGVTTQSPHHNNHHHSSSHQNGTKSEEAPMITDMSIVGIALAGVVALAIIIVSLARQSSSSSSSASQQGGGGGEKKEGSGVRAKDSSMTEPLVQA